MEEISQNIFLLELLPLPPASHKLWKIRSRTGRKAEYRYMRIYRTTVGGAQRVKASSQEHQQHRQQQLQHPCGSDLATIVLLRAVTK